MWADVFSREEGGGAAVQGPGVGGRAGRPQGPYHRLEAGVQLRQERRLVEQGQHPLLHHGALHVVVLDDHVLLQDLDGVQLLGPLPVG